VSEAQELSAAAPVPSSNRRIPSANDRKSARDGRFFASLWGGFPLAMTTSICRSMTCFGLYLWMGMTRFSSTWILSHSTWYKFAGHVKSTRALRHLLFVPA
jgi:hypothetical protein